MIPDGSTNIKVTKGSEIRLESYDIIDHILYLNVESDEFPIFSMYNPDTNESDIKVKGFRFGLSYNLPSGMLVEYPLLLAEVADFATFKLVLDEPSNPNDRDTIKIRIDELGKVTVPSHEDFNLRGYTIENWYLDQDLVHVADFSKALTQSQTFYAKVKRIPKKYTVSFESNTGSKVDTLTDVLEGSLIEKPLDPSLDNHDFVGWYLDQELSIPWNFELDTVENDMTLYAKWEEEILPSIEEPIEDNHKEDTTEESIEEVEDKKETTPKTSVKMERLAYATVLLLASLSLVILYKKQKNA